MTNVRRIAAAALIALAGATGLLVATGAGAALGQDTVTTSGETVLADSPWDGHKP
jgi:hypothetical protein